jgi:N-acyl-D-aspartate/D-glutamate deacylase
VEEALTIGRRAGVRVQLSHHKAAGKPNWGKVRQSIALIEQARAEDVVVGADQYPYIASATGLSTAIPGWAHEGGVAQMVARLRDPDSRKKILAAMQTRQSEQQPSAMEATWQNILVVGCKSDRALQGKTVQEIADGWGKDSLETILDLLTANDGTVNIVKFMMAEEDVQTVMRMPWVFVGSDAGARAPTGPLAQVKYHPRSYGTFPRALGRYVRELGVLEWEEAIAKMTARPAEMLGLARRGALRPGYFADIVVFDPASLTDTATFTEPIQFPTGIDYVIVNGIITVDHGRHTGARAGHVLRKP